MSKYNYFIVALEGQPDKLIKTNSERCEVITYRSGRPAIMAYPAPYPDFSGETLQPYQSEKFEAEKMKSIPLNQ